MRVHEGEFGAFDYRNSGDSWQRANCPISKPGSIRRVHLVARWVLKHDPRAGDPDRQAGRGGRADLGKLFQVGISADSFSPQSAVEGEARERDEEETHSSAREETRRFGRRHRCAGVSGGGNGSQRCDVGVGEGRSGTQQRFSVTLNSIFLVKRLLRASLGTISLDDQHLDDRRRLAGSISASIWLRGRTSGSGSSNYSEPS